MTMAITFSRQNDVALHPRATQHWTNLILVVILVSESKALYQLIMKLKMDKALLSSHFKAFSGTKKPHA